MAALLRVLKAEVSDATRAQAEAAANAALAAGVSGALDTANKAALIDHVIHKSAAGVLGENLELELRQACLEPLQGKLDAVAAKVGAEADPELLAKVTAPCLARLQKALEAEVMESMSWSIAGRAE